jgi:hypothetical protein
MLKRGKNVNHEFRNDNSENKYLLIEAQGVIVHCNKRSSYPSHPPQLLFLQSFQQVFVTIAYVLLPKKERKKYDTQC